MVTTLAPPALVVGAPRLPLGFGLFSVVAPRGEGADSGRWQMGVQWEPVTCEPADGIGQTDCDSGVTVGLPKNLDPNAPPVGVATPFTVYGHHTCSPVGNSPAQAQDKATEHLTAREEQRAEQALWTGDLGNVPNLADDATTLAGGSAVVAEVAVALLEDFIAATYGGLGVIHMTRGAAIQALADRVLEVRGGRLVTVLGTPVVAGGGYPGTSPSGGTAPSGQTWVYASPALFAYRGEVFTSSSRGGDLLDARVNDLYAVAERTYLLGYDPCGVGAVLMALGRPSGTTGGTGGGGGSDLTLSIGTIPGSPVPAGTDLTVEVHANQAPADEVHLWLRIASGPFTDLGEMTEVSATEFVANGATDAYTAGTVLALYATSGATASPIITVTIE